MFKPIVIIPFYNHLKSFEKVLPKFLNTNLPLLLVDDGSEKEQSQEVEKLCIENGIHFTRCQVNKGKGQAVIHGLKWADKNDYTHAVQIDADGQHNLNDIDKFLELSKKNKNALICGQPIYANDAPKSRLYGRKITNFWVAVETLQKPIDAMCGFRVYPVKKCLPILSKIRFLRMGFDIEILVKIKWSGINVFQQKTEISYPKDGISHFNAFKDNFKISCLHTYLCCLMPFVLLKKGVKKCKTH